MLKDVKTPGPDGIPPEALKADPITTIYMLHHLFLKRIRESPNRMEKWIPCNCQRKVTWECAGTGEESHSYPYQVKSSHAYYWTE